MTRLSDKQLRAIVDGLGYADSWANYQTRSLCRAIAEAQEAATREEYRQLLSEARQHVSHDIGPLMDPDPFCPPGCLACRIDRALGGAR